MAQRAPEIKALLADRGLAPKRSLGQNFLIVPALVERLVEASGVGPRDLVLEVGPGTGTLTEELLERNAHVIACELDDGLADLLAERLAAQADRLTLIRGDVLDGRRALHPEVARHLAGGSFRLVANLPYGAASPLMVQLARMPTCAGQYVTVQREIGQRLRAEPGGRDFGELAVMVGAFATVRRIATLPPGCFWPPPKVTSEMIAIEPRPAPLTDDVERLEGLCRRLFSRRRKQLSTILGRDVEWPAGVSPSARPEQLTIVQLVQLAARTPPT